MEWSIRSSSHPTCDISLLNQEFSASTVVARLPPGTFASVFVTHEVLDAEALAAFRPCSDGASFIQAEFGGTLIAFARPPMVAPGGEPVVTMAVIEWPDAARFPAWPLQRLYEEAMLQLRAQPYRGSVYLLPRSVVRTDKLEP